MSETLKHEIFVFITNESKNEYKKYSFACVKDNEIKIPLLNESGFSVEVKFHKEVRGNQVCARMVVKADGWKKDVSNTVAILGNEFMSGRRDDYVTEVLDCSSDHKEDAIVKLDKLMFSLEEQLNGALKEDKVNVRDGNTVITFFIHWGGGDSISLGRKERKFANFLQSTTCHRSYRAGWQAFYISSLPERKACFNVDSENIEVPDIEGLHQLKGKLSRLSKYNGVFRRLLLVCGFYLDGVNLSDEIVNGVKKELGEQLEPIAGERFNAIAANDKEAFVQALKDFSDEKYGSDEKSSTTLSWLVEMLTNVLKGGF